MEQCGRYVDLFCGSEVISSDLEISFGMRGHYKPEAMGQQVVLSVNGESIAHWTISNPTVKTVIISKELAQLASPMRLEFQIEDPVSPKSLGASQASV